MIINPADVTPRELYKIIVSSVLPRPIAWVSSMDKAGQLNVAPFSYFSPVCTNPPTLLFCTGVPATTDDGKKDTLRNIEQTSEFVINLTNEETAEAMNLTATLLPPDQSEFEWAGLTPAPSEVVNVPRVAEAPIAYECKLQRVVTVNDQPGGAYVVFGEVQCLYIRDDLYGSGAVKLDAFKPIGRLGGPAGYTRVTDTFEMHRVPPPQKT